MLIFGNLYCRIITPKIAKKGLTSMVKPFLNGRGSRIRTHDLQFWRSCQIKRTVQIVPTVEPFVALGLLNLMPFDALLMLYEYLIKFDAQLPKNQHT